MYLSFLILIVILSTYKIRNLDNFQGVSGILGKEKAGANLVPASIILNTAKLVRPPNGSKSVCVAFYADSGSSPETYNHANLLINKLIRGINTTFH